MSSSIGGFFATLGIKTDTNSFDKSKQSLDIVTNSVSRMMGTVRNASAVLGVLAITTGKTATAEVNLSKTIGLSTEALDNWRIAARIAGADANGLVSEMNTLEQKMLNLKQGNVDQGLATSLGFLGFDQDYGTFAEMDAEQRVKAIFDAAKKLDDQEFAGKLVGDILGQNARTLYLSEEVKTNGLDALLNKAQSVNFVGAEQTQNAAEFFSEFQETTEAIKSLTKSFGSDVAKELTPIFSNINNWLSENGDEIKKTLTDIATNIGLIVDKYAKPVIDFAGDVARGTGNLVGGIAEGDVSKVEEGLFELVDSFSAGITASLSKYEYDDLMKLAKFERSGIKDSFHAKYDNKTGPVSLTREEADYFAFLKEMTNKYGTSTSNKKEQEKTEKNAIDMLSKRNDYLKKAVDSKIRIIQKAEGSDLITLNRFNKDELSYLATEEGYKKFKNKINFPENWSVNKNSSVPGIQDGIIKPDGQITQVAQDDWVFAFRNISDFAAGFIPHNNNNTNNEIVINQNITINGAKDMPQVVRQQAYIGVQNGILEAMQNNINRMQMMNGLQ